MNKYILLIYSSSESEALWASYTPDQARSAVQKYVDFAARLRAEGRLVDAEGLSMIGNTISRDGIVEGARCMGGIIVGGYYVFTATNLAEATSIARDCPALENGGTIEVREQMHY